MFEPFKIYGAEEDTLTVARDGEVVGIRVSDTDGSISIGLTTDDALAFAHRLIALALAETETVTLASLLPVAAVKYAETTSEVTAKSAKA